MSAQESLPHTLRTVKAAERLATAAGALSLALLCAACTFGPRDPIAPVDDGANDDKVARATALEGSKKVDKDGFRIPDAQEVREGDASEPAPAPASDTPETQTEADAQTEADDDASTEGDAAADDEPAAE